MLFIAVIIGIALPALRPQASIKNVTLSYDDTIYVCKGQRIRLRRKKGRKLYPKKNRKITLGKNGILKAKHCGESIIWGSNDFEASVIVLPKSEFCKVRRPEKSTLLTNAQQDDFQKLRMAMLRNQDGEVVPFDNLSEVADLWFVMTGDKHLLERNQGGNNILTVKNSPDNYAYASGLKGSYPMMEHSWWILKNKIKVSNQTSKPEAVQRISRYIVTHAVYDMEEANRLNRGDTKYTSPSQRFDGILYSGKGICSSYSQLFQIFCAEAGIPCQLKRGFTEIDKRPGSYHQWNSIKLGKKEYDIDPTGIDAYMNVLGTKESKDLQ